MRPSITISRALIGAIAIAILMGLVPAGIALDRRLAAALEQKARADLELAPRLLSDRSDAYRDAMMMHAKEFAHAAGLADALMAGDTAAILRVIERARESFGTSLPLIVAANGRMLAGPHPDESMIDATRRGQMPVKLCTDGATIRNIALAPVESNGRWIGAAGLATPLDQQEAAALSGLTRSQVVLVSNAGDSLTATTLDTATAIAIHTAIARLPFDGRAHEVVVAGTRYLAVASPLADAGRAFFIRSLREELAVLPELRRTSGVAALAAIVIALVLGALLAQRISRPVRLLAGAAGAMRDGSFDAPLPSSRIAEVELVARQFGDMRRALALRLAELREANAALEDRTARLTALQSDLMQRDRLAATGRLVAQLAHEIRNPVANLRNCLELIHRRAADDPETREFAALAIDELLRMHELAEQMLDVNRPRDTGGSSCQPVAISREVARLVTLGAPSDLRVDVTGDAAAEARIAPDALKQVLLNLVQNAAEAASGDRSPLVRIDVAATAGGARVTVSDNGPGIPPGLRARIFDPFFTTKSEVHGVGLGLFVAEGLVRGVGGRLRLDDAPREGTRFVIDLPGAAPPAVGTAAAGGAREGVR
jgi:signal transduction histidine kinase